ncbi:MAG: kelch repeat-containing protein [Scytonema sp. PMC 1069.18]|nr:kelch repeat-containing protein [Scytonema sp. PMC 1069.18]MEC4886329.1 kelch repeat-containing protein [Scytonema sp. PMC 1070.18]
MIRISDATATEGLDQFLVFDLKLSDSLPFGQSLKLKLVAEEITAKPGIDFFNQDFEYSLDEGKTWQPADNKDEVTFEYGLTRLKVRLAVNNDTVSEGTIPETMKLKVADVLFGTLDDATNTGTGSIIDDDGEPKTKVTISNPVAVEGTDDYLIFDVGLSSSNNETLSLQLAVEEGTAKPNDFVSEDLEVSTDGGSTWQLLDNDNQLTIRSGINGIIQARLPINDDSIEEDSSPETVSLRASVLANPVDDAGVSEVGLIIDNDIAAGSGTIYQAEDAISDGPAFFSGRGAEGTGYIDYQNPTEDYIEWTVDVPTTGLYNLSWRYANGSNNRPLELAVNGVTEVSSLDFVGTGDWTTWDFVHQPVTLDAGSNDIRLTAIGSSGANFDYLEVTSSSITYQAEDANFEGPVVFSGRGAEGTGYVDYQNPAGDFIEWTVNVQTAGTYNLSWRYANGASNRPLELAVNGEVEDPNLDFIGTGDWLAWNFVTQSVALNAGSNTIRLTANGSSGANFDYLQVTAPSTEPVSISPLPLTDVRVEGDLVLNFDGTDEGLVDRDNQGTGFTMADPTSNPGNPNPQSGVVGYWSDLLDVSDGVLKLSTTSGIQYLDNNNLDNALGVGLNLPSRPLKLQTTLVDLPTAPGGAAQAGLWFGQAEGGGSGSSEDNYIKFIVLSTAPGNYVLEALQEQNGVVVQKQEIDIPDDPESVSLNLVINPDDQTVTPQYSIGNGLVETLTTFTAVPQEWFSFDQAGINPSIATRSFGGIFATHRNASASQTFSFDDFSIIEGDVVLPPSDLPFSQWSIPVDNATSMEYGPDGRLYVATLFGDIHVLTIDPDTRTFTREIIETIPNSEGGNRLTLGIAVDPDSTPDNVVLWASHSSGSVNNGALNSGKVSRLSGPGFTQKEDVITGLPRAIANHASNDIDFGPDGRLYIWQGGNTGTGSANNALTEFGDRPEQVLSAALLVADVKNPNFNGNAASNIGEFIEDFYARTDSDVQIYASGLRNTYDGVFHSNGNIYAPDNGLGTTGTVPPVPRLGDPSDRSITTLFGQVPQDDPGKQPDPLNLIVEGGYYGHPNPYRDEVVFKDGTFQGFDNSDNDPSNDIPPGHPDYEEPLLILGVNRSADGIIEYTADNFFGQLQGDLLITNYSQGDNVTRVKLSSDGSSVINTSSLVGGFTDPLPIAMGPDGSFIVGEFNGSKITILEPLGIWRTDLPDAPAEVLDAGSATLDGKLYMVGGKTVTTHVNSLYIYDPGDPIVATDDVWTTGPNLPGSAVENPAVVAFNGNIYVFGGSTDAFSGAVDNAAVFDPTTSSWSLLPDMPTARGGATAQVLDNKIYVVGGLGADGASLGTVEVYDPLTGQWSTESPLQTRRDNPGGAVIDDVLYVFGGRTRNSDGSVVNDTLNTMEIYNPAQDAWSFGEPMPTGRRALSVGTLNDRIQVIGGEAGPGGTAFDVQEEYNPVTDTWRSLPGISTPRHGAAFGTIDDVIYVAGGGPTAGSAFTNVTEAFTL